MRGKRRRHWVPDYFGKRMDDWLVNRRLEHLPAANNRRRPLPCSCGHLNVIGSRAELEASLGGLESSRAPAAWVDRVPALR